MTDVRNGQVAVLLKKLGVRPSLKGWKYLNEAVNLVIEDETILDSVTYRLYPEIAKKYGVTPQSVERCVRHAIETAMGCAPISVIKPIFGHTIGRDYDVTNAHFIATVAEIITDEPDNPVWNM